MVICTESEVLNCVQYVCHLTSMLAFLYPVLCLSVVSINTTQQAPESHGIKTTNQSFTNSSLYQEFVNLSIEACVINNSFFNLPFNQIIAIVKKAKLSEVENPREVIFKLIKGTIKYHPDEKEMIHKCYYKAY